MNDVRDELAHAFGVDVAEDALFDAVLDCGVVTAVETFDHADGVVVASSTGAYHSTDGGATWNDLGVPLGGRTWRDRRDTIVDDVHQVLPISEDVWLATTGYLDHNLENLGLGHAVGEGGLYRTTDAGDSWTRIDDGNDFSYVRCVFVHDGRVFFCGGEEAPPAWTNDEHDAALFESTNFGRDFERVPYPGEPHEVIETWDVHDGDVVCGSGLFDVPDQRDDVDGRIMRRDDSGDYETVGRIPANVSRIEVL